MKLKGLFQFFTIFALAFSIAISGCTIQAPKGQGAGDTFSEQSFDPEVDLSAKTFASQKEFEDFISRYEGQTSYLGGVMRTISAVAPQGMMKEAADMGSGAAESDYSQTNNQVTSVDEADTTKTDGEYIYTVSQNNVFIVKAYPGEDAKIVSTLKFNSTPQGIFVKGDKLAVFGYLYDPAFFKEIGFTPRYGMTFFNIYDISDKEKPSLEKDYKLEGSYFQARMTGDYIYFILTSGLEKRGGIITPLVIDGDVKSSVPVDRIHYYPMPYSYPQLATIHAISMTNDNLNSESVVVEGASNMYMSEKNIYITYTEYINEWQIRQKIIIDTITDKLPESDKALINKIENTDSDVLSKAEKEQKIIQIIYDYIAYLPPDEQDTLNEEIDKATEEKLKEYKYMEYTVINKVGVENGEISVEQSGKVPGHVMNQFSMDESNDVFRIATTVSQRWMPVYYAKTQVAGVAEDASSGISAAENAKIAPDIMPRNNFEESTNNVYTLDKKMEIMDSLEGLAKGEQIYSTRFIGERLYMVTFKQVDPFFVIDLSDPENIKELGKLKIPGFSRYLHPYDDNIIIGIGRDATSTGRQEGLKISLFDVSDVENPKEIAKFVTEEKYAQSTAEYEHKAFLFSKEKNLLVIPAYSYNYGWNGYQGGQSFNGAMVFKITKDSIELRGIIDHSKGTGNYYGPLAERSLYINELLYTKSQGLLRINKIDDLSSIKQVELTSDGGPYKIY